MFGRTFLIAFTSPYETKLEQLGKKVDKKGFPLRFGMTKGAHLLPIRDDHVQMSIQIIQCILQELKEACPIILSLSSHQAPCQDYDASLTIQTSRQYQHIFEGCLGKSSIDCNEILHNSPSFPGGRWADEDGGEDIVPSRVLCRQHQVQLAIVSYC